MKSSNVPMADEYFKSIACPSVNAFQQYKPEELVDCYEKLLTETKTCTQKFKDQTETTFGFSLLDNGVLACHTARRMLTIDKVVFDSQHNYFSNGIATSEIVLMLNQFTTSTGLSLADIQRSVREVSWRCSERDFSSPSARSFFVRRTVLERYCLQGFRNSTMVCDPTVQFFLANLGQ